MKVTSRGDVPLEALPTDNDERWKAFLDDYNDLKRQIVTAMRAITFGDNTPYREKSVNLVHGVESEISTPLTAKQRVRAVIPLEVEGLTLDSSGAPTSAVYALGLSVPLAWRHSDADGRVFVTAKYDISPTSGVTARVNLLFVGE